MKKKTTIKRMPTLREAFVVREKFPCGDDEDMDNKKDVKEALPPPIPGSTPGKPPPLPGAIQAKPATPGRAMTAGVSQYASGIISDIMGLEKDLQINKSKYVGLDINRELQKVKTEAEALKVKVDNWMGKADPLAGLGNA